MKYLIYIERDDKVHQVCIAKIRVFCSGQIKFLMMMIYRASGDLSDPTQHMICYRGTPQSALATVNKPAKRLETHLGIVKRNKK
jgi:hypothetical protein